MRTNICNEFYVIGDIESNERSFADAAECIRLSRPRRLPLIFLGDVFDRKNLDNSLKNIEFLLKQFGANIKSFVTNRTTIDEIKNIFRIIQKAKSLDAYDEKCKLKYLEHNQGLLSTEGYDLCVDKKPIYIFIYGNKEIAFVKDMASLEMGRFDESHVFTTSYAYLDRQKQRVNKELSLTNYELNVLITYLSLCKSFVIWRDVLLTHIYSNALVLKNYLFDNRSVLIRKVICGHNRCFGRFFDSKNKGLDIYIFDLSFEQPNVQLKNYLRVYLDSSSRSSSSDDERGHQHRSKSNIEIYSSSARIKSIFASHLNARMTFLRFRYDQDEPLMTSEEMYVREMRRIRKSACTIVVPEYMKHSRKSESE